MFSNKAEPNHKRKEIDAQDVVGKRVKTDATVNMPPRPVPQDGHLGLAYDYVCGQIAKLETDGFCVIEGVLTPAECQLCIQEMEAYLLAAGIDIHDPDLKRSSYPNANGIVQYLGVGQMNSSWRMRTNEWVRWIFAIILGTNDLVSSTDGACAMPPHFYDTGARMHTDQALKTVGLRTIQGLVNYTTSHDELSGSLSVIPGGHLLHEAYGRAHPEFTSGPKGKKDWFQFEDSAWPELGGVPQRVFGGVGSLVLWDSRLPHRATPPLSDNAGQTRPRRVGYVCMEPRSLLTPALERKKQIAFRTRRTTTHPAASKVIYFSQTWQTYGKPVTVVTPPPDLLVTPEVLELAAMTPLTTRPVWNGKPALIFSRTKIEK